MKKSSFLFTKVFLIFGTSVFLATLLVSCQKKERAVEKKEPAEGQEVSTNKMQGSEDLGKSEYSFYSPAEDNASWVEALLLKIEEERIAEDLEKMESELAEYQLNTETEKTDDRQTEVETSQDSLESQTTEKSLVEKFFEEAREGKSILGKKQELHFFEFDNEILSPQYTDDGFVIVHSSDSTVTRNFYNEEYLLEKREDWNIKSASNSKRIKTELFNYSPETKKIVEKEIQTEEYDETVSYNEESQPVSSKRYILEKEKKYLIQERKWIYDSQNRIISDFQNEYKYINDDYKTKPEIISRRYEYAYNDLQTEDNDKIKDNENKSEIPPDFKYYENDVLKMQNKYTAEKGNYISWIYFDEILSVKTYYKCDVRIRDEYYNNGHLFRTKLYENESKLENSSDEDQTVIRKDAK